MTKRAAPWISLALCALLAACGAEGASADASDGDPTATTASTAPVTTTTTVPPPYSFDGSVPPPPLVNTGTDYEAIFRSLDAYTHWLLAHRPDSELLNESVSQGTRAYDDAHDDLEMLSTHDYRLFDSASRVDLVEVLSEKPSLVALRVSYSDESRMIVNSDGSTVDSQSLPRRSKWSYVMSADGQGRWRIAAGDPIT